MDDYRISTYGDRIAHVYDEFFAGLDPAPAVRALRDLAAGRRVLELAIGTGRVALPLADAGVEVFGVDASEAMLERLRAKPQGRNLPVAIGDLAKPPFRGPFGVVFVAFNTFFALSSQDEQVGCFAAVAEMLEPGGVFVIEAFVPDASRFVDGQRVSADVVGVDEVLLEVSRHDRNSQTVSSQQVVLREGSVAMYPVRVRYAYPSELDLMARLAGLRLRHRWGGWAGEPFGSSSPAHVSVYERPAA